MGLKRLYLVIGLVGMMCGSVGIGADDTVLPVTNGVGDAGLDRQLKINKAALLKGSSEQIRIDAASVMLFSADAPARKILLAVLGQSENAAARAAVCKALSQVGGTHETIQQKSDFIAPLLSILMMQTDPAVVEPAAQATLIFEYKQISTRLEAIAADTSLPVQARLNAIYALKLQPDMDAIVELIELLGDLDPEVVAESEKALQTLGIPVDKDLKIRKEIIMGLKRKGKDAFLRDWLIRQEKEMRELRAQKDTWRQLYLAALDRIYEGISEDVEKGKFLTQRLADPAPALRLWSLEEVMKWRQGAGSKIPPELGPILVDLISDPDREVRLKTAKLLSMMVELDCAEKLLGQIKIEDVRREE